MRIAFDHQAFVLQSYGGVSRYFARLAQELLSMGQHVRIFAPLHRNSYLRSVSQNACSGRYVSGYPPKSARLFFAYNQFKSRRPIARWKPDLLHETYYSAVPHGQQAYPTVITVYDMIQELFPRHLSSDGDMCAIKSQAIERADHIICISENTKSDLLRLYGTPASKVSVVHLGFDRFASQPGSLQDALSTKPYLLYVGQREGYKNFIGFLTAVASSKRLLSDFNIIAFGGPTLSAAELRIISSLGYGKNQVQHKGGPDGLLGGVYRSAKALVYPSLYEGFGIPPLEAMVHECPVISSNTSSMPEVIGPAGEFFDPSDPGDMRRAIEAVVYSDSAIDHLKKEGTKRLGNFSWAKCAQETLSAYGSLAK